MEWRVIETSTKNLTQIAVLLLSSSSSLLSPLFLLLLDTVSKIHHVLFLIVFTIFSTTPPFLLEKKKEEKRKKEKDRKSRVHFFQRIKMMIWIGNVFPSQWYDEGNLEQNWRQNHFFRDAVSSPLFLSLLFLFSWDWEMKMKSERDCLMNEFQPFLITLFHRLSQSYFFSSFIYLSH